jgi:hypothetical protein
MRAGSRTAAAIAITLIAAGGAHGESLGAGPASRPAGAWRLAQQPEPSPPPEQPATAPEQPPPENRPPTAPAAPAATPPASSPSGTPAVVLDDQEVSGIVGKSVRSSADEDMGRIVDVIIDFGGFLGIGTRKIAVDWRALKFAPAGKPGAITLELTRNQVRVAPEYKRGEPLVVIGPAGPERPAPSSDAATTATPEK